MGEGAQGLLYLSVRLFSHDQVSLLRLLRGYRHSIICHPFICLNNQSSFTAAH